jgi:glycerol-3-phosphate acyltransferase PlsY
LLAAALAPVYTIFINGSNGQTLVISVISLTLIIKHWQNLQRLLAGQESKIGSKKK